MIQENWVHVELQWLPHCLPSPVLSRGREKLTVLVYADLVKSKQESRSFRQTIFLKYINICEAFSLAPSKNQLP